MKSGEIIGVMRNSIITAQQLTVGVKLLKVSNKNENKNFLCALPNMNLSLTYS